MDLVRSYWWYWRLAGLDRKSRLENISSTLGQLVLGLLLLWNVLLDGFFGLHLHRLHREQLSLPDFDLVEEKSLLLRVLADPISVVVEI